MPKIILHEFSPTNPINSLSEIEIFKTQSVTERDFCIGLTLRFDAIQVACDNWAYAVVSRLKEATVQVHTENSSLSRDGRAGDAGRPNTLSVKSIVKTRDEQNHSRGGSLQAQLGAGTGGLITPSAGFSGKLGAAKSTERHVSETYQTNEMIRSIEALSGGRWRITDIIKENLGGKYEPEDHFCKIAINEHSKSGTVTATLYFYPRDLTLEALESEEKGLKVFSKERPNNTAVAKALLAKYLRSINNSEENNIDGRINLGQSKMTFTVEDDDDIRTPSRSNKRR